VSSAAHLDAREQAVMDHILSAMRGIEDLGLRCNETELTVHVHGLQSFVIQHMLQRIAPGEWGSWFDDDQLAAPPSPPTNPGNATR
jgi:hypothetical protein